jgi:4-hydroxybenzoate polyprenyltransferase
MAEKRPLVVDIDGTFLKTDLLFEGFWAGLGRDPLALLRIVFANLGALAPLKRAIAEAVDLPVERLPVNPAVLQMARDAREAGHEVVFASASDATLVERLAAHHEVADRVIASDGETNLKGPAKAAALVEAFGEKGFDYVGDSQADVAVWEHAGVPIIVGAPRGARARLEAMGKSVVEVPGGWRLRDLVRAIRPQQWVKNVLLFVPAIAAHAFDLHTFLLVLLGIAAFSAAASCIYVVNDLLDLDADRRHPTKRKRPFASGAVPIQVGMAACAGLGLAAVLIGAFLGVEFVALTLFYMVLSLAYSLKLKRLRWIDIAMLASFYTLRVVAGGLAGGVDLTGFLIVFIFPVFLTLGCVKRMTELALATSDERLPGRGYGRADRGDLLNVAALGTVAALVSFFLYSFSAHALARYPTQWLLWVALIPMAIWLIRMVLLGYAGKQDYDPIVFALKDRLGIGLILITLALMLYSAGVWKEWFGG